MPEYKCICCGEVTESDDRCSCPVCGYGMYETPYDRADKLRSEIIGFMKALIMPEIQPADVLFKGKKEDEGRFPSCEKVREYIFSASKTEILHKRMTETVTRFGKHINESFHKEYTADLAAVKTVSDAAADKLIKAMAAVGIEAKPDDLHLPEITLDHSEIPDEIMLNAADMLLDRADAIAEKIYKFIVKNNLYTAKRKAPDTPKKSGTLDDVPKCLEKLDKVIAKKYVVDILDDGSAELSEMLRAYWQGMSIAMRLPVFQKTDIYSINDISGCNIIIVLTALSKAAEERFSKLKEIVFADDFLSDMPEDKLFDVYDQMLALDTEGIMKATKCGRERFHWV